MKSRKINFTAAMVSMALAIGAFGGTPPSISAASTDDAEVSVADTGTTRNLTVDFMGRTSYQTTSQGLAKLTAQDVGTTFWIGVAVDNVNDLDNFTNGIYSLELQFEYDPTYIAPADSWDTNVASANIGAGTIQWDSSVYEAVSGTGYAIDTSDRYDTDAGTRSDAGWLMAKTCIRVQDGASTGSLRFKDLASADKQYLALLPFKLVSMPDLTSDSDPKLLRLALGCTQFNIGSGADGLTPAAEWDPDTDDGSEDETDLSTLLTFGGDISLFTTSTGLTDMAVSSVVDTTATPAPEAESYALSQSTGLDEEGFNTAVTDYYISVPNDTDEIMLTLTTTDTPTVTANDSGIAVTAGDGTYTTAEIALNELTAGWSDETETFSNTITVKVGSTTYTIHARRLLEPEIVLNYGNSPYGEIMKADNIADEDKDAAKEAFNTGNKFTTAYCPDGKSTTVYYSLAAWGNSTDENVNLDRSDTALFVFEYQGFTDPGFVITDSLGETVELEDISRSITVCVLPGTSMDVTITDDMYNTYTTTGKTADDEFTNEDLTNSNKCIMPNVYDLEYEYFDDNLSENTTFVRKVVIIPLEGDTNLDGKISVGDLTPIKNDTVGSKVLDKDTTDSTIYNLFYYRVMDTNSDEKVSVGDLTFIKNSTVNNTVYTYY